MRRVEVLDRVTPEFQPHDHVAWADTGAAGFARLVHKVVATAPEDVALMVVSVLDQPVWNPAGLFDEDIASGRLLVRDANAMYHAVLSDDIDIHDTLTAFDDEVTGVLARGLSGVRVIADNTPMVTGSAANFERWLEWEQLTDEWQSQRPVTGICYFDSSAADTDRLETINAIHPLHSGHASRGFTLFHDARSPGSDTSDVRLAVGGSIDAWDVDELVTRARRRLDANPELGHALDLSRVDYVHHRLFIALRENGIGTTGATGLVAQQQAIVELLG